MISPKMMGVLCLGLLAGCSAHLENVQAFRCPDFDTIVARGSAAQDIVARHCHKHGAKRWDNGTALTISITVASNDTFTYICEGR